MGVRPQIEEPGEKGMHDTLSIVRGCLGSRQQIAQARSDRVG
jgi:hypothetical protein